MGGGERSDEKADAIDSSFLTPAVLLAAVDVSPPVFTTTTTGVAFAGALDDEDVEVEVLSTFGFLVVCGSSLSPMSLLVSSL